MPPPSSCDTMDADRIAELEELDDEIEELEQEYRELRDRLEDRNRRKRETVTELLYDLQDELDDSESVALIDAEEWSRGGHYTFTEALTPDGIVATDVQRVFKGHGYTIDDTGEKVQLDDDDVGEQYWIEGDDKYRDASSGALYGWKSDKEPLDVEAYLSGRRDAAAFVNKLGERLRNLSDGIDEVPANGWGYD